MRSQLRKILMRGVFFKRNVDGSSIGIWKVLLPMMLICGLPFSSYGAFSTQIVQLCQYAGLTSPSPESLLKNFPTPSSYEKVPRLNRYDMTVVDEVVTALYDSTTNKTRDMTSELVIYHLTARQLSHVESLTIRENDLLPGITLIGESTRVVAENTDNVYGSVEDGHLRVSCTNQEISPSITLISDGGVISQIQVFGGWD